jgi:predicted Zn-ribbon and HTH transcriptional regulator
MAFMTDSSPMPGERSRTIRQQLLDQLHDGPFSAAELSRLTRQSERDVLDHLEHLLRAGKVKALPASCAGCGFRFEQRTRSKKPGKCPQCKSTRIRPPRFTLP